MKRLIAFAFSVLMLGASLALLAACDSGNPPVVTDGTTDVPPSTVTDPLTDAPTEPVTEPVTDPATAPVTDPATEPVTEPVVDPVIRYVNPLTGLPTENDLSGMRPVAVSIDNVKRAQPTVGLSLADVLIELPVEGFETRILAVFLDYQNLPTIGNVRSVREYTVRFAADFDAVLVHAGSDTDDGWLQLGPNAIKYGFLITDLMKKGEIKYAAEREDLWYSPVDNIDSLNYYPMPMFRDLDRMYNMSTEHSLMVNGEIIVNSIEHRNYRTDLADGFAYPYLVGASSRSPKNPEANSVFLPYNPYYTEYGATYEYNSETGLYYRSNFDHQPSIDGMNNEQLAFKNLIILEVPAQVFPDDPKTRLNVNYVGEGTGYYCVNGRYEPIIWRRKTADGRLVIYSTDNSTLQIVDGKVMINIYPAEYHDSIKIN